MKNLLLWFAMFALAGALASALAQKKEYVALFGGIGTCAVAPKILEKKR